MASKSWLGLPTGLTTGLLRMILCRVNFVIHCAASIRFDLPIQESMKQNYTTTGNLLDLASAHMSKLECFTYVSTAFVNFNQPDGTRVEEKLYPLEEGTFWEDDIAVAERLMALPEAKANAEVRNDLLAHMDCLDAATLFGGAMLSCLSSNLVPHLCVWHGCSVCTCLGNMARMRKRCCSLSHTTISATQPEHHGAARLH